MKMLSLNPQSLYFHTLMSTYTCVLIHVQTYACISRIPHIHKEREREKEKNYFILFEY